MKYLIIASTLLLSIPLPAWANGEWTQIRHGSTTQFQPYAVVFADKSHAWAYNRSSQNITYLKKMTGALPTSWVDLKTFPFRINAIVFKTRQLGWLVGDTGQLMRTVNGGRDWHSTVCRTNKNLLDIDIRNKNIWVVGQDNTISHSPDNGKNWQTINANLRSKYIFTGVSFSTDRTGWITGYRFRKGRVSAVIIYTRNSGKTWVDQTDNIKNTDKKFIPKDIHATEAGWAYIVGTKAKFLMTTDQGKTWKTALDLRIGTQTSFHKISFPVSRIGWIAGDHGRLLRTMDAGFHWVLERTPIRAMGSFCNFLDIQMFSPKSGYAFTDWGAVIRYAEP